MFIRKKKNQSGSVSVQIINKHKGYKVEKTIGCTKDREQIEVLMTEARQELSRMKSQAELFTVKTKQDLAIEAFVSKLSNRQIHTIGPELIFGRIFDQLGFNKIKDRLFRNIIIARLAFPTSKVKTSDYLYRYQGKSISVDQIYRFLDRLGDQYKEQAEKIAYQNTKEKKDISVVFYDMTTLYFEAEDEDDLRKIGFSKDGKFQKPQIMLGLLVGKDGFPIGYDVFEGNKPESHTLIPVIEKIRKKYNLKKPIIVADAGLLSKNNIEQLIANGYQFILGGRIKNESEKLKSLILEKSRSSKDGESFILNKSDKTQLIVNFSIKRQKKDAYNRDRGLKKLRKKLKSGILTKSAINNRGYNKFLSLSGNVSVSIDESKIKKDERWDGLKGYITNSELKPNKILDNYKHLWQIEKAFRMSKTDLRIRPIYHYRERRIKAHICISFIAYAIYKELERILEENNVKMSVKRAADLTHNMYELMYQLPSEKTRRKIILEMDDEQRLLTNSVDNFIENAP